MAKSLRKCFLIAALTITVCACVSPAQKEHEAKLRAADQASYAKLVEAIESASRDASPEELRMLALARMDADNMLRWLDVDRQRSNDAMMRAWDEVSYVLSSRADFEREQKSASRILMDRLKAEAKMRELLKDAKASPATPAKP